MTPLLIGAALDLTFGDPRWLPHPIRGFGWLACQGEHALRRLPLPHRLLGVVFWAGCVGLAYATVRRTRWAAPYWVWMFLALRDLDLQAGRVIRVLEDNDLEAARRRLSMIVGRDTASLDESEILRAVVETVAENLSDGVVAPLFYYAVGGPAAMGVYKAVNTLDSMVGYHNERYRDFGWCAARMDDVANLVPARLTAVLIWITAFLLGFDYRRSIAVTLRDAHKQPSPNAGYPEASMAGALGVRLGGLNYYGGIPSKKEFLGDPVRPLRTTVFTGVRRLLYGCAALMIAGIVVARWR